MGDGFNAIPIRCRGIAVVLLKVIEGQHKVLLMKRADRSLEDAWCYIGGGIEEGEKAWEAALREIQEETGITKVSLYSANICEQFYHINRDSIWIAPVFVGYVDDSEDVVLNCEHKEFKWLTFGEAKDKATFPGNDTVFEHIEKHFANRKPTKLLRVRC